MSIAFLLRPHAKPPTGGQTLQLDQASPESEDVYAQNLLGKFVGRLALALFADNQRALVGSLSEGVAS